MEPLSTQFNEAALRRFLWLMLVIFFWMSASTDAKKAENKLKRRRSAQQEAARLKPVRRPVPPAFVGAGLPRFG